MALSPYPSIRRRLTISLLAVFLLFSVLAGIMAWQVIGHEMGEWMDLELRDSGEIIHNVLAATPADERVALRAPEASAYDEHLLWQEIDTTNGVVRRRSRKAPAQAMLTRHQQGPVSSADGAWRMITFDFMHANDVILVVAQSQEERIEAQNDAALFIFSGSLLLGLLTVLLLYWLIGRELRPLNLLSMQVRTFDPLLPDTAPQATERAELKPIEDAIGELGQRLAQRLVSERAFTSHAAHALRTPVAGIDAQLAIALKEAPESLRPRLGRAREAATRLGRVMQALLTMFRSGMEPQRRTVRLPEVLAPLSFNALQLDILGDPEVNADPDLLVAALLNLLDNAQRHRACKVVLSVERKAGWTRLLLQDDGEGCPPDRLELLREALDRQDYAPGSGLSGLGLILTDLVMRAHGGRLHLNTVPHGFCVELTWPAA